MQISSASHLIAVDIGNSRMKIGRFAPAREGTNARSAEPRLPEPVETFELPIVHSSGEFDAARLFAWYDEHGAEEAEWLVGSVHRGAAERLGVAIRDWERRSEVRYPLRTITYRDVPIAIRVEEPARVGIDRLLAALAVNRLRQRDRAAIVVDLGTAITVDLVEADGAFAGGAILPGIGMSARALAEQTDALPHVDLQRLDTAPQALGKSTTAAIEAGLFWGTVGAIRKLISQLSEGLQTTPEVFLTGGASPQVAELLNRDRPVRHVPHLVLSGIALVQK